MPKPYVHFTEAEFAERQARVHRELEHRGLDGLIVSRSADLCVRCGVGTCGFVTAAAKWTASGRQMNHITHTADLASIEFSSLCRDVRVWEDAEGNPKSAAIKDMLQSHGMEGKRIGVQLDSFGMLPGLYLELKDRLEGWCELVDASDLIRLMRLVKSPQELDYHRRAGEVLDRACARAIELTVPGADEGQIMGQVYQVMWESGADIPANRLPMGHGEKALNVRSGTGRGRIGANDQITFEMGDAWLDYPATAMFSVLTGPQLDGPPIR